MATYTLTAAVGSFVLTGKAAGLRAPGGVSWAEIVGGVVVAVSSGSAVPTSDSTTIYSNLSGVSPTPSVGWYFSEICQTYSAAAPTIPPGDVAPPYPPGGTPPTPGDPTYPTGPGDDGGTAPPAFLVPSLIAFHADREAAISVASCPSASTELSTKLRTAFDLTDCCLIRLQADVETEVTGALLTLKYSLDAGATWTILSAGGTGPTVTVATAGDQRGTFLNIDPAAMGDVLLSVFVSGGDGATTLELGNVAALCYLKANEGDCAVVTETSECGIEAGVNSQDFALYASIAALEAAFVAGTDTLMTALGAGSLDDGSIGPAASFNGVDGIIATYSSTPKDGYPIYSDFTADSSSHDKADVTYKRVLTMGAGLDTDGTAPNVSSDFGLCLVECGIYDGGGGFSHSDFCYVSLRGGNIYFDYFSGGSIPTGAGILIDPISAWTGRPIQLLIRIERHSSTETKVTVCLDDACPATPTIVHQAVYTSECTNPSFLEVQADQFYFNNLITSPVVNYLHQYGYTFTASDYGL